MLSKRILVLRSGFFLCLFVTFLTSPWWATYALALVGVIAFSWYIESVFLMYYIDTVFSIGWIPWLSVSVIIALLLVEYVTYYVGK